MQPRRRDVLVLPAFPLPGAPAGSTALSLNEDNRHWFFTRAGQPISAESVASFIDQYARTQVRGDHFRLVEEYAGRYGFDGLELADCEISELHVNGEKRRPAPGEPAPKPGPERGFHSGQAPPSRRSIAVIDAQAAKPGRIHSVEVAGA